MINTKLLAYCEFRKKYIKVFLDKDVEAVNESFEELKSK